MDKIRSDMSYNVGGVMLPRPFKANRLGHIGLYVADQAASHRFYADLLGFHETDNLPGIEGTPSPRGRFYTYNNDHHALVLLHNSVGRLRDDRYDKGITINQISFQVGTLEEVVNAHRLLQDSGANVWRIGRDQPGSNWAVYFMDADRHTVELYYGMEQIGWNRRSKPMSQFGKHASATEPALPQPSELDEIREVIDNGGYLYDGNEWDDAGTERFDVGGVLLPRPFKIVRGGPVSLFVQDIDRAIEFYVETMGLWLTEESRFEGHRIAYLRTGTEHHTIALIPLGLRKRLELKDFTSVASYGLQVGNYEQLKDAVKFLEGKGFERIAIPAEVHVGIDYAAHFADPDGHVVQLYFHMDQVGWDGAPKPASARRTVEYPWPDVLDPLADSFVDRTFAGPLG